MDKMYDEVKSLIEKEIDEVLKKDDITPADLDTLDKGIDILKDICEIDDMHSMNGMSSGRYPNGNSYGSMPYNGIVYYNDGVSGNRGDRSYGNSSNRIPGRYSRDYYDQYDNRIMDNRRDW